MELSGALSNPFAKHKSLLNRLTELHKTLLKKTKGKPRQPRPVPPRPSPVLETVVRVLTLAQKPMRAREIHDAAETLAGQPLRWSSVKACLAAGASAQSPRFERLSRGMYKLRVRGATLELPVGSSGTVASTALSLTCASLQADTCGQSSQLPAGYTALRPLRAPGRPGQAPGRRRTAGRGPAPLPGRRHRRHLLSELPPGCRLAQSCRRAYDRKRPSSRAEIVRASQVRRPSAHARSRSLRLCDHWPDFAVQPSLLGEQADDLAQE